MLRSIRVLVGVALAGGLGCSLDWTVHERDGDAAHDGDADVAPDADVDGADGDADADADADVVVGPPARVVGEMTTTGAVPAGSGCVASGTGLCLRSDSTDPGATELSGGAFRLRGIVVGGGSR